MSQRRRQTLHTRVRRVVKKAQPKSANPFASLVENLCEVQGVDVKPLPRPQQLRIALVSMPSLQLGANCDFNEYEIRDVPSRVDPEDCKRSLVKLRADYEQAFLDAHEEAVTYAVDKFRAHIVCVSELGLPHRNIRPIAAAQKFAKDLSADRNVMIIAGTSHDHRTLYNTGYVYHPGGAGWAFHKTVSASSMGELISSPPVRRILTVKTLGLRIAVMICLDVADYATLASVIRVKQNVDMVLVPCYTFKWDKMLEVAKTASKALRGIVAMVNAHIPNGECHIARFGADEEPAKQKKFDSGAVVSLFRVNPKTFEEERGSDKKKRDYADVDWLFGNRDLPYVLPKPKSRPRRPSTARAAKRA